MIIINGLGRKISLNSGEARETSFLYKRISILVQRFNAVLLQGGPKSKPDNFCNKFVAFHVRWANYISSGCKLNFLQCICAKNYENWQTVDKDIAKNVRLTFLADPHMTVCRPFLNFLPSVNNNNKNNNNRFV